MSLGNTLRAAREACGITTSELAARTHMLVQIVEGLENEDFRRIPAPIYGRGFIKLYCEAVNIDPKPLQAEFMELFNRPKDAPTSPVPPPRQPPPPPPQVQQPVTTAEVPPVQSPVETSPFEAEAVAPGGTADAESIPAPETESPTPEPPSMAEFGELFAQRTAPAPQAAPQAAPPKRSYGDLFGQTYAAEEETHKPSAAEKFRNTMSNVSSGVFANVQKLPPNTGRIVTVSICALLTLSLLGWGVFELYKATTPAADADDTTPTKQAEVAKTEKPKEKAAEKTTVQKSKTKSVKKEAATAGKRTGGAKPGELNTSGIEVPPLYID